MRVGAVANMARTRKVPANLSLPWFTRVCTEGFHPLYSTPSGGAPVLRVQDLVFRAGIASRREYWMHLDFSTDFGLLGP